MKRYLLLAVLLLSFLFSASVLPHRPADALDSVPAGWVGIYDRAGLEAISSAPEKQYILMSDINLSSGEWKALCSQDSPFTGILNGNGHTIYGMTVSDSVNACGLFSYLSGGTVESLTISGSASGPIAGLVVGKVSGGVIRNCSVSGTVASSYFGGGVCGQLRGQGATVSGCASSVSLSGTGSAEGELLLGGICGGVYGTGQVVSDCTFTGRLAPTGNFFAVGGVAGELNGGAGGTVSIARCSSTGALSLISYTTASVGGIVGRMEQGNLSVTDCTFQGAWSGTTCRGILFLGGIVGRGESSGVLGISKCRSTGTLVGVGHLDYVASNGEYRCIDCSTSLGKTVSENSGMTVGYVNLDVTYPSCVGGILGAGIANGGTLTLSECSSSAVISAGGTPVMLGGIAGLNRSDQGTAAIRDCFFAGRLLHSSPVHGEIASAVGGIAGSNCGFSTAVVERCVSVCEPEGAYPLATGAVVGISGVLYQGNSVPQNSVTVSSCYVFSENDAFGIPLSGVQMSAPASFQGFDFNGVWQINSATGLPNPIGAVVTPSSLPIGDVDGNGAVTRLDGILLTRYLSGDGPLTALQLQRADHNRDGEVNSRDVVSILQNAT